MAIRLALGAGLFRVSKPGVNVLTASQFDLIFSEAAAGLAPGVTGLLQRSAGSTQVLALPEPGFIPVVYLRNAETGKPDGEPVENINCFFNAEKTTLTVVFPALINVIRYVIFKNRQF